MAEPDREPGYSICVSEQEVIDLAAGFCPKTVRAMALMLLETDDERCRRNAEKPVALPRKKRQQSHGVITVSVGEKKA